MHPHRLSSDDRTHLDEAMSTAFGAVGLKYTPFHENDTSRPWRIQQNNETLAMFRLTPETLSLHGKERVAHLFDAATRRKIAQSDTYRADVTAFSEFSFDD